MKYHSALLITFLLAVTVSGCGRATESAASPAATASHETAAPATAPTTAPTTAAANTATDASRGTAPIIEASAAADVPNRILDPRADELLRSATALLAKSQAFAFEAEERFDEIPSGQPRTLLTNLRRIAVQRPNRFVADVEGDTLSRSVWFDGKNVSVYDRAQNVYATIDSSGSIDKALDLLSEKYSAGVPLADLLYSDPYAVLTEEVTYSKYLGLHLAGGVLSHHLVFSQPTIEWQIWIDAGEQPVIRQLAISYVREPGEPQYVAVMTKWRLLPSVPAGLFQFEPPPGAAKVAAESLAPHLPGESRKESQQ